MIFQSGRKPDCGSSVCYPPIAIVFNYDSGRAWWRGTGVTQRCYIPEDSLCFKYSHFANAPPKMDASIMNAFFNIGIITKGPLAAAKSSTESILTSSNIAVRNRSGKDVKSVRIESSIATKELQA